MEFGETIKREHQRIAEMLARLEESSEGALKTRERLSRQLTQALGEHTQKEDAYFYRALQAHQDAHEGIAPFLAEAGTAHDAMRQHAAELDGMAKDDPGFTEKAGELRRMTQQHLREEERLLSPLRRALDQEERAALDRAMTGEAEERAAAEAGGTDAEAEAGGGAAAAAGGMGETAEGAKSTVLAAAGIFSETAQVSAEDMQVIAACSSIAAGGLGEMRHAWLEWLGRNLRASARVSQELMRCATLEQLAEIQRGFVSETLDNLLEGSAQLLRISSRVSEDAARPIEDRAMRLRRAGQRASPRAEQGDEALQYAGGRGTSESRGT